MGIVVRIPRDVYKEVKKIQEQFRIENGVELEFSKAMKIWVKKIKNRGQPRGHRFPDFS